MEFTGERVVPGRTDIDLMNEHAARYAFAARLVGGERVLDLGCGVGYGAARLASEAWAVVALDNALAPLRHGSGEFHPPEVHYVQGDCRGLPFPDASFDSVVAFEVIEHIAEWRDLLQEAKRVLRPAGQLIVSTPNRLYYGESRSEPNPYHVHEFSYEEFQEALNGFFPYTTFFFENHAGAITFVPCETRGVRTEVAGGPAKPDEAHFFVAVCSRQELFGSPAFVYVPKSGNVLRERERHIALLKQELAQKTEWLEKTSRELEDLTKIHSDDQRRAQEKIDELEADLAEKTEWAREWEAKFIERSEWAQKLQAEYEKTLRDFKELEQEAGRRQGELQNAIAKIDDAEQRVIERTEWAQRLDREIEALRRELQQLYASRAYRWGRRLGLAPEPPGRRANGPSRSEN